MKEISFIKDKRKYLHGVVLAFAALAAGLFLYFYFFYHGTADGTVMVEIPKNATGREIGEMLEEKGVIRSAAVFRAMLLATGNGNALKSGYYTFRRGSTVLYSGGIEGQADGEDHRAGRLYRSADCRCSSEGGAGMLWRFSS